MLISYDDILVKFLVLTNVFWISKDLFEIHEFVSPVVFGKELKSSPVYGFWSGQFWWKWLLDIHCYLYSLRRKMLDCEKNCENVNSVWLVLIRIWFRNLVWGEFFKLNHLCSISLNSIGTTWNYSIFRAQFSIEKFSIISLLQYLSR